MSNSNSYDRTRARKALTFEGLCGMLFTKSAGRGLGGGVDGCSGFIVNTCWNATWRVEKIVKQAYLLVDVGAMCQRPEQCGNNATTILLLQVVAGLYHMRIVAGAAYELRLAELAIRNLQRSTS